MPSQGPVPPLGSHSLLVFLLQVGLLLLAALLLGRLAARFGLPVVVGELCAGVVLGPSLLGQLSLPVQQWLFPRDPGQAHLLEAFAQIGVLLMVGLTGSHLHTGFMRAHSATILRISACGLIIPFGFGLATGMLPVADRLAGETSGATLAFFLGVAMCVSAIPVIAKTLLDLGLLHHRIGQLTIAAAVADDMIGWMLLSVVAMLATAGAGPEGAIRAVVGLMVTLLAAIALGRPLVRRAFDWARLSPSATPTAMCFVILVLLCAAGTQALGLEAVFGAVVCGVLISRYGRPEPERMAAMQLVIVAVLAPLFFATSGLKMDLSLLADPALLALAGLLLAVAVVGKFVGAYLGARISRLGHWEAVALGAGMNARGAIEIVVATVGLQLGVINQAAYTIVVLVAVVTSLIAPPILRVAFLHIPGGQLHQGAPWTSASAMSSSSAAAPPGG